MQYAIQALDEILIPNSIENGESDKAHHRHFSPRNQIKDIKISVDIQLEPEAHEFIKATANPPYLFDLGPDKRRAAVDEIQSDPVSMLPVEIEDRTIPGGPDGPVSVRILRPQNAPALLPAIVYFHGAGWVFGNAHTHDQLIRELAVGAQAAVVFPNYSLSPEAQYLTAIQESYAVVKWVEENRILSSPRCNDVVLGSVHGRSSFTEYR